jgi:multidrug resistance protein, MATE family
MKATTEDAAKSQQGSSAGGGIQPSPPAAPRTFDENTSTVRLTLEVVKRSIPLGLAAVAQSSVNVVLVAMTGKMVSEAALGATSLACGLLNATAFSFAAGFCGALETVLSHSYGRDPNSKLFGVYAQRMSLMLLIIAAIVGPVLAFSDSVLIAIGQNIRVAHHTGQFCRVALFGVYSVMTLEMMRRYFACQHLNQQLSVNLIVGAASFPVVLWVCLKLFGFHGAAIAWVILITCMPASLIIYLYVTGRYRKTWGGWGPAALMNWRPLLRLAFPSMAMMMSEWMSLEINLIIAGFAPTNDLAAFSIVYQCSGIMWSLASGVFIEAAVLVGNALGQGKPQLAKRCAIVCIGSAMGFALVNIAVLLVFQKHIPRLFTDSTEVHTTYRVLLPYFVVYHFFDCVQSCMMGVLRGCGLQALGALAIALVYSIIGVPVGTVVFFCTSVGVRALWAGPAFGVTVVGFPLYICLFKFYIPWDKLEGREDEIPSLNASMDERSMQAHTITPPPSVPPSEDDERTAGSDSSSGSDEGGAGLSPQLRRRHGSALQDTPRDGTRQTPNSTRPTAAAAPPCMENASFTSLNNFYLPSRSILSVPPFVASSPTPSEAHPPPPVLANDAAGEGGVGLRSTSSPMLLPPADTAATMKTTTTTAQANHAASRSSSSRSPSAPPSSTGSNSSSAPASPSSRRSRASSASTSVSRGPGDGQRTNLPSSSSSSEHDGKVARNAWKLGGERGRGREANSRKK